MPHGDQKVDTLEMQRFVSLVELLRWRASQHPTRCGYTFLTDGETKENSLTYQELDRQARIIGARLQDENATGKQILLLYPPGLKYISAFFGCLYAGAIAVPAYPPNPTRLNRTLPRLLALIADSQATIVLTTSSILSIVKSLFDLAPNLKRLQWLATDHLSCSLEQIWQQPPVQRNSLALLQYTSGSTTAPKGVMLTHGNLLYNSFLIYQCFGHTTTSQGVIWLPPYHDMGLIGGILQPLYGGFPVTLMSPLDFLSRPLRWLQAVSRYRATTSGGPNFAYDLCARKIRPEERSQLDLSTWKVAFNGAEPVRAETIRKFAATFADCGFKLEAFLPCYGLAEATLIVSGGNMTDPPVIKTFDKRYLKHHVASEIPGKDRSARALVGCGQSLFKQKNIIVDPSMLTEQPEGQIGEIWISGPSVSHGYWNQKQDTEQTFKAYLSNTDEGPFLRTGDLGFLQEGELFITGRLKDLITIRGHNHYPQDIENTVVSSHSALRPGCGAAFSVDVDDQERLVVVQEVRQQALEEDLHEIILLIRQAVVAEHGIQIYAVLLLRQGSIPKTSSGKIQRHACRDAFISGHLETVAQSLLAEEISSTKINTGPQASFICKAIVTLEDPVSRQNLLALYLQEQLARILNLPSGQVETQQNIITLGLDSLSAIELQHEIENSLGINWPVSRFLQFFSISDLASQILNELAEPVQDRPFSLSSTQKMVASFPLSYNQQTFWFLHELAPDSAVPHIAYAAEVHNNLDVIALRHAFQALVKRHSALQVTFTMSQGEPCQQPHAETRIAFHQKDISTWNKDDLHKQLVVEANCPFDLEKDSLLRLDLFTRSEQEHVILLVVHHIVADLWSLAILVRELDALYHAEKTGIPATLPPIQSHYVDYVQWQSRMVAGSERERLWAYWQKQLAGELPTLNLPTDRQRPTIQTYQGHLHSFKLDTGLTRELKALGRTHGATLYMVLLTAFQILLYRYTGQEDILIGSPTTGRTRAEWSGLIGCFVNTIILRNRLTGSLSFTTLLSRVRQTVLDGLAHQDFPFSLLVKRLQPERDTSHTPLFQIMFTLQKPPSIVDENLAVFALDVSGIQLNLDELKLSSIALERHVAQFDLMLAIAETSNELMASFYYNTDLFDATTIKRMATHFQTLLAAIVTNPQQQLAKLALLPDAERQQILFDWNYSHVNNLKEQCVHKLIEEQATRTPEAIAITFKNEHLTYHELNRRSNQLANYLQSRGVGPEMLVGICMERSIEMMIGLLGILKTGAAYVPLASKYPNERVNFMLTNSQASMLVTQEHLKKRFAASGVQTLLLDTDRPFIASYSEMNPNSKVCLDNLAYVIYTSGSMGQPKGVAITHRSVAALLSWAEDTFAAEDITGLLASTSISFDLSIYELFFPLSFGGKVILVEDVLQLPQLPEAEQVTLINTVPSSITPLVEMGNIPTSVQVINLAGELLPTDLVQQIYQQSSARQVYDLYGPSEDTTYSTIALREGSGPATIGRPISNTQIYLLDAYLSPVPIGVPGEIYIGGSGLARGYLQQPGLTAEHFIPHPFSNKPGNRLYKTGDLARYQPGGNIEFLGRIDHQVKIRGFRIELGEVEVVLRQHPTVQTAVVVASEDGTADDKRLIAYVVPEMGSSPSVNELRRFLETKLPSYMVPSVFMRLNSLPKNPNGKVNRKALPTPPTTRPELSEVYVFPISPAEKKMAEIWTQILQLNQVGIHDNFFDLGGHSILAIRLLHQIREAFHVDLSLSMVLSHPTVANLVDVIEQHKDASALLPAHEIKSKIQVLPRKENKFLLSFAQQQLWILNQLQPKSPAYNIPIAFSITGTLNLTALEKSINTIIKRHEILRTAFTSVEGHPVQKITPFQTISIPIIDLQNLPKSIGESQSQQLATRFAQHLFDLTQPPLLQIVLLRMGIDKHLLLLIWHHIIADGWSLNLFMRELALHYNAITAHESAQLPGLPIQYIDFAAWQRAWLHDQRLKEQLRYWRKQLGGELPLLQLFTDKQRPTVQTFHGQHYSVTLSQSLMAALQTLSKGEDTTLFIILLAAFNALLYRHTGQEDIIIGSPVTNRTESETANLIGPFINILALRTDLTDNPTFRQLIQRVHQTALDAYTYQNVPFEKLVEEINPERHINRSPLFQVMFVWNNMSGLSVELSGLSLSLVEIDTQTSKFDLTLNLTESPEGLLGWFEYNTDLFKKTTIARMGEQLQILLSGIIANPDCQIATLPILTKFERDQLLVNWNATNISQQARCYHQLFAEQAVRTPDAVAAVFNDQFLTYRELNCRANQLANYLQSLGVGPEICVGIHLHRSLEMIIGLLGILKAGGAFLPLDPTYPAERLAFMLQDAHVPVLLTQQRLINDLPPCSARLICLDTDWIEIAKKSREAPISGATVDNLVYVIYTSGSTGQPKGTLITHQGLSNMSNAQVDVLNLSHNDRVLQFASFSFDASIFEICMALRVGATLCLASQADLRPGPALLQLIQDLNINIITLTPSALAVLPIIALPHLHTLIVAGEACPATLIAKWGNGRRFFNFYGPTEATIWTTSALCHVSNTSPLPIGRPILHTQIYLLNSRLQLVPIGSPGEICIGGVGLAHGYLHQPKLTAEKFIPHPFSNEPDARLYRTGDLGRYLPDGSIEFLGRVDRQVKVRGYRIEPGEIQTVLENHQAIRNSAILTHNDISGNKQLIAYVVPHDGHAISVTTIRQFLQEKLPNYMVPSTFIILEGLPLTPNGKIDYKSLPVPEGDRPDLEQSFTAPRTQTEEVIAKIWAQSLGLKLVGIHDNFFELGGHSLLAMQIISQVREMFQIELPVDSLFKYSTVADAAKYIETIYWVTQAPQISQNTTKPERQVGKL